MAPLHPMSSAKSNLTPPTGRSKSYFPFRPLQPAQPLQPRTLRRSVRASACWSRIWLISREPCPCSSPSQTQPSRYVPRLAPRLQRRPRRVPLLLHLSPCFRRVPPQFRTTWCKAQIPRTRELSSTAATLDPAVVSPRSFFNHLGISFRWIRTIPQLLANWILSYLQARSIPVVPASTHFLSPATRPRHPAQAIPLSPIWRSFPIIRPLRRKSVVRRSPPAQTQAPSISTQPWEFWSWPKQLPTTFSFTASATDPCLR